MPSAWSGTSLKALTILAHFISYQLDQSDHAIRHEIRQVAVSPAMNDNAAPVRMSYAAVSLLSMFVMAGLFGSRLHSIADRKYWTSMTLIQLLPYGLYFFGMAFNISAAVTVAGLGLQHASIPACKGAMYVCLVFYVGTKICVQIFLIERAHVIRHGQQKKRLDNPVWLFFMLVVIVGFGTIAVLALLAPVGMVDEGDGQCRIGLPQKAVLVLMTYDILINTALTIVFLMLLRPLFQMRAPVRAEAVVKPSTSYLSFRHRLGLQPSFGTLSSTPSTDSTTSSKPPPSYRFAARVIDPNANRLKSFVGKSLLGAIVMLAATVVNLAILYRYEGHEHGWLCFMCCLIDVTWTVAIIHFLTEGRKETYRPSLALHRVSYGTLRHDTLMQIADGRRAQSET